jgi:2-polyprenyl-3-methyl-5-hydroxy-6-metoxy-1,4-benzoquinol methylase
MWESDMSNYVSTVQQDFDVISSFQSKKWDTNKQFYKFIINNLPANAKNVLEVGSGQGKLCKELAKHSESVTGIDLSDGMISKAKESNPANNIKYFKADYLNYNFPENHFDCIITMAALHHINFDSFAVKVKHDLKPNGRLIVIDLLQNNFIENAINAIASIPLGIAKNIYHNGFIRTPKAERDYWNKHGATDVYLTYDELINLRNKYFPDAEVKKQLFWRYSLVWCKP